MYEGIPLCPETERYIRNGWRLEVTTYQSVKYSSEVGMKTPDPLVGLELIPPSSEIKKIESTSRHGLGKAQDKLEKKIVEREEIEKVALDSKEPYQKLVYKVQQITKTYFQNNWKAKHLSRNETYQGWDIALYQEDNEELSVAISIHNAANKVIAFDPLTKNSTNIRMNLTNVSTHNESREPKLLLLLDAIYEYLDTPYEERYEELKPSPEVKS